jgi:hypothetical protein
VEENDEMVDLIRIGGEAIFYQMRCLKTDDVKAMVANNCRIWPIGLCVQQCRNRGCLCSYKDCSEENWDKTIGVNLKGVWLCMKYDP